MKLTLLKPFEKIEREISWLEAETSAGNFVITPGHAPMILALKKNSTLVYCLKNGSQENMPIEGGMLDIDRLSINGILFS